MGMTDFLFTSESVTEGHPDKVADQISDAVLDAILAEDPNGRVACETLVTTGLAVIAGEITTSCYVHMPDIVRQTIREIGYCNSGMGFDWETCAVVTSIDRQSPDIAQGVEGRGLSPEQGAGDQGLMFGYASTSTENLMPMPIWYAHRLAERLAKVRKDGTLPWLRPDGKTQVTVEYSYGRPVRVHTVLVSTQHAPNISQEQVRAAVITHVINPVIPSELLDDNVLIYVNPTGRFVIGGPLGDAGVTGRKIIVDTYGGMGRHGGGAFSGKDPTKVDRSAAYAARWAAKNIVAAGLADRCEIQVAYAIGVAHPLSVNVETFGTGRIPDDEIARLVTENFDLRPGAILRDLKLRRPIYRQVAVYGHFGRDDLDLTWERTDKAALLRQLAGLEEAIPAD